MRTLLLSIAIGSCASAYAQNWALLNPAYKYNYNNDGSDMISNQIFVTHIDTLGVDSFRYELNGVAKLCDTCAGPQLYLFAKGPQFLQRSVNTGSGMWHFHDPGSFVVMPNASQGSTWLFDTLANVQATVTLIDTVDQFGSPVGRKTITLSDGGQLMISEAFGILSWSDHALIGVQGPQVGRVIPTLQQFFPYSPGDILQYAWGYVSCHPCYGEDGVFRNTITSTNTTDSSIATACDHVAYTHHFQSDWNNNTTHWYTYANEPSTWEAGRNELPFFDLIYSYPGQFIAPRTSISTYGSQWACIARHGLTEDGRYRISCDTLSGDPGPSHFLEVWYTGSDDLIQFQPMNYPILPDEESGAVYEEGVGLKLYRASFFDGYQSYVLDAAVIAGDTTGTLLTDDQLLTVRERPATADVTLHPNPAENLLIIESSSPQSMDWQIVSMMGQHLLSGRLDPNIERIINVSTLPAGNYLIQLSTAKGIERRQLIIAR